jgi:hypothetical protein
VLAPYAHQLNRFGSDCAADCPACLWRSATGWDRVEKVLLEPNPGPGEGPHNARARRCLAKHGRIDGAAQKKFALSCETEKTLASIGLQHVE